MLFHFQVSSLPNVPPSTVISRLLDPDDRTVFVAAHRGAWREAPENSLEAIEKAIEMGVEIVEIDVRKTLGGELILHHNPILFRPKGAPTLEEALLAAKDRVLINLDKAHGYVVNKFARRSCYREDLFYPKGNMHEDMVLMGQLLFHCKKVVLLPEALYHYRRNNSASETRQARKVRRAASARNFLDLYEAYLGRMAGSPVEPVQRHILRRCLWIGIRWDRSLLKERPYLLGR